MRSLRAVTLVVLGILLRTGQVAFAAETGQLTGNVVDARGQITNPGEAVVFLCDAQTGKPIDGRTGRAIDVNLRDDNKAFESLRTAITDASGRFQFDAVAPAKYRLVAQSWSGTKGLPPLTGETSTTIILHGVAEAVEVKSGETTSAAVRPLGRGVLRITNDPEEAHAFLLISLAPTLGDGILGPYGWGDAFVQQLIGYTHMDQPHVTIVGLPEDRDIHVGLLNYDNSPGVGAAAFKAGQKEGTIRIIAGWSNGHKDPPPELVELTNHLEENKLTAKDFLTNADPKGTKRDLHLELYETLRADPDREVEVKGLGKRRLADVLSALLYVQMRKVKKN